MGERPGMIGMLPHHMYLISACILPCLLLSDTEGIAITQQSNVSISTSCRYSERVLVPTRIRPGNLSFGNYRRGSKYTAAYEESMSRTPRLRQAIVPRGRLPSSCDGYMFFWAVPPRLAALLFGGGVLTVAETPWDPR